MGPLAPLTCGNLLCRRLRCSPGCEGPLGPYALGLVWFLVLAVADARVGGAPFSRAAGICNP
jgi:hypothetical protein